MTGSSPKIEVLDGPQRRRGTTTAFTRTRRSAIVHRVSSLPHFNRDDLSDLSGATTHGELLDAFPAEECRNYLSNCGDEPA
jgi:hypothetical protein